MPQGPDHLREKFMTKTDDGIARCENIIHACGGRVRQGLIMLPQGVDLGQEVADAVQYLIEEWDYDIDSQETGE